MGWDHHLWRCYHQHCNNGSAQVEGIPSTLPATVGTYGGTTDDDNSGVMKYISIRHTGIALASNNEIQGLTLAGVGNGTVLEHIESYASADDGIEIFGGTVNMKWVSIAFAEDDCLDYDQGWTGKIQHLFIIQAAGFGDRIGEWDGADTLKKDLLLVSLLFTTLPLSEVFQQEPISA